MSISSTIGNSPVKGAVLFVGDLGVLTQDGANLFWDNTEKRLGIGINNPTARLHLPAGTNVAGTAPLKLTSGVYLGTPESGAIEYNGTDLTYTDSGLERRTLIHSGVTINGVGLVSGGITLNATHFTDLWALGGQNITSKKTLGSNDNNDIGFTTNNMERLTILSNGNVGIRTITPEALLHLGAGGVLTGTAPLKFTSGLLLTTPEAGAFEFDGTDLFFTPASDRNQVLLNNTTTVSNSIFMGVIAGTVATNATNSIFLGYETGYSASDSYNSNFFGYQAGYSAPYANDSNFLGYHAGITAINASNSNFLGNSAGFQATNASYSNLFGYQAGKHFSGNNIGSNNIIIGTNISLPNATADMINIGGVLFGTGTYSTITGNPSITAVTTGKIGIATIPNSYTLEVGNSSVSGIVARFTNSTGVCDIDPTTTALVCSSDQTLKKNIILLTDDFLPKINQLKPITYNWNNEKDNVIPHIGFLAQEVEQIFPDLVSTDPISKLKSLNYTGLTPYMIKAIQELNLKVEEMSILLATTSLNQNNLLSIGDLIRQFLEDVGNKVNRIFAKEFCVEEGVCLTKEDIQY